MATTKDTQEPTLFTYTATPTHSTRNTRPVVCPFTVAIDTREQRPYDFSAAGIVSDAKTDARPLTIPSTTATLAAGDYSIVGMEARVAIERKSLSDLYSTLGQGFERFRREHERLAKYEHAVVIIEADIDTALFNPPKRSRLDPKTVARVANKWPMRYGVHWRFVGVQVPWYEIAKEAERLGIEHLATIEGLGFLPHESPEERLAKVIEARRARLSRMLALQTTFRTLEAFWNLDQEKKKNERKQQRKQRDGVGVSGTAGTGERVGSAAFRDARGGFDDRPF